MRIEKMKLSELKPADYNPRVELKPGMKEFEKLKKSIEEFGFVDPPIFNIQTGNLVGGHQRVAVAQYIGVYDEIEVSIVDLPIEKEKTLNIALNKISGLWDGDKIAELLNELDDDLLELSGFDEKEIDVIIDQYEMKLDMENEAMDDEYEIELPNEPKSKLGDVFKLGNHRLMCGDSTDPKQVGKLMNQEKADLLITDPPYNVDYQSKEESLAKYRPNKRVTDGGNTVITNDKLSSDDFRKFLSKVYQAANSVMNDGSTFYIWYATSESYNFIGALHDIGWTFRQILIWHKNHMVLGRQDYQWNYEPCLYGWKDGASHSWYSDRKQLTVMDFDKPMRNEFHPTMKPVPLFDYQIRNSSRKGSKVLDLFGGSGTTLIACEQNERNAYLMELDPRYVDVIIDRWEKFTGNKAEQIS